jgi:proteasome lid subunit RPN8/RPN11
MEVTEIRPADNIAASPLNRFEVDPAVLIAAHRHARSGGLAIIGHYHSHPRGEAIPSTVDAKMAQMDGEIWLLVGGDGEAKAWRALRGGPLHKCFEPAELTVSPQGRLAPDGGGRHEGAALV